MNRFKKLITISNIFFLVIFLLATAMRFQPIVTQTFAFTYDVGRDMLNLSQIVYAHKIPLIGPTTGLPGLFYGPWWYYILTPSFFLSGGNPQGVDSFMALVGLATVIVAYFLGMFIEGQVLGLLLAGLVAFSGATVSLSVQIWNPNIAQLFVLLVLFLLVKIKKSKISLFMYLCIGLLLGLTIDSEVVFGLLFTLGSLVAILALLRKEFSKKGILFALLGLFIIFSPRIFFELKHQFVMTTHIIQLLSSAAKDSSSTSFVQIVGQRLSVFWDMWNWSFSGILPLSIIALVGSVFQTFLFFRSKKETLPGFTVKVVAVVSTVFFVGLLFFKHDIFSHYLVALPVYFLMISGVSMYILLKKYTNNKILFIVLSVFLIALFNPIAVYNNFFGKQWSGDASVYKDQLGVLDYIYAKAGGREFAYQTYSPARIDYPYQYLFAWYGKRAYHYQPLDHSSLIFVIFETDDNDAGAWYWKVEREKESRMIDKIILPGNITVQTRQLL